MRVRLPLGILVFLTVLLFPCQLFAEKILLITGGDSSNNAALESVLQAGGNSVTIGPTLSNFTGGDLSGYNAVILSPNGTYTSLPPDMPVSGQQALVNFVNSGGGLITSGAVSVLDSGSPREFTTLQQALPTMYFSALTSNTPITFTATSSDPTMNHGLAGTFTFASQPNGTELGGTEAYLLPLKNSTVFYTTDQWQGTNPSGWSYTPQGTGVGAAGWLYGVGRVLSLSTYSDNTELTNPNYEQMLNNSVNWVTNSLPTIPGPTPPIDLPPVPEPTGVMVFAMAALGFAITSRAHRKSRND